MKHISKFGLAVIAMIVTHPAQAFASDLVKLPSVKTHIEFTGNSDILGDGPARFVANESSCAEKLNEAATRLASLPAIYKASKDFQTETGLELEISAEREDESGPYVFKVESSSAYDADPFIHAEQSLVSTSHLKPKKNCIAVEKVDEKLVLAKIAKLKAQILKLAVKPLAEPRPIPESEAVVSIDEMLNSESI